MNHNLTEDERYLFTLSQRNDIVGLTFLFQHLRSSQIFFNINCLNERSGSTLLMDAAQIYNTPTDIISLLLENGADANLQCNAEYGEEKRPLYFACEHHRLDTMKLLLESGADINHQDEYGYAASHIVFLVLTSADEDLDFIPHACLLLLEHGADVNLMDNYGSTPFFNAVAYICSKTAGDEMTERHRNLLQLLLNSNPNVNIQSDEHFYQELDGNERRFEAGETPLHTAVLYQSASGVRLLLNEGVDFDHQNSFGFSPFFSVIADLCKQALDVDEIPDRYFIIIAMLLESSVDVNVRWEITNTNHEDYDKLIEGDTPLHCTVKYQCIPAQRLLLKNGADANIPNCYGITPLFQAIYDVCTTSNQYKITDHGKMKSIQMLLESHSNINIQLGSLASSFNRNLIEGDTPLHCAVKFELIDIVPVLLRYNPDVFICNSNHEAALDIARQKFHEAVLVPDNNDQKIRLDNIKKCLECHLRYQIYCSLTMRTISGH